MPLPVPFVAIVAFLFGTLFGSFFNVAIYRIPLGLSVNRPRRSFCFRCGSPVRPIDNIPILSYLLLKGQCRDCGVRFSARYAFVELLTGILFVAVVFAHNDPVRGIYHLASLWYLAFTGLLLIATFTDFDHWIIPEQVSRHGAVVAVFAALIMGFTDPINILTQTGPFPGVLHPQGNDWFAYFEAIFRGPAVVHLEGVVTWWMPLANSLIGLALGPLVLWAVGFMGKLIFRKEAMGFGDVELFALIGATLGPISVLPVLVIASFFGAFTGLLMIVWDKFFAGKGNSPLRLGAPTTEPAPDAPLAHQLGWAGRDEKDRIPHHLPFGPWIALAAVVLLVGFGPIHRWFVTLLFPY